MNRKNDVQVTINGKTYNIAGYENVEYLHRIADYLNSKQNELKGQNGHNIINDSERNILMLINVADDYLKLKERTQEISFDADGRQKDISNLKRELVSVQTRLDNGEQENKALRAENVELQKKVIKLETELDQLKKGY